MKAEGSQLKQLLLLEAEDFPQSDSRLQKSREWRTMNGPGGGCGGGGWAGHVRVNVSLCDKSTFVTCLPPPSAFMPLEPDLCNIVKRNLDI